MESALSEGCRTIEVAELHRATLGVGRYNSLAVAAEVGHIAALEVVHRTAVVGIGLGAVLLHKVAVGSEDNLAAVDSGYGEELHMAAEEEGIPVVGSMDCVEKVRMMIVGVGSPGCTGPAVHILPAAEVTEAVDPVRSLHLADSRRVGLRSGLPAHILKRVR